MSGLFRAGLLTGALLVFAGGAREVVAQHSAGWYSSFDEAEREARQTGQPLLIHFQAWYCGPCKQMDAQVFNQPDVQQALRQGIVAVQLDVSRESEIASRFGASTVPRDVVVFPDGSVETLHVGFVPRSAYLMMLRDVEVRGRRLRPAVVPTAPASGSPSAGAAAADADGGVATGGADATGETDASGSSGAEVADGAKADAAAGDSSETILGLEGFCPVRLHQSREWVLGRPELTAEHRGMVYRFASEQEREAFLADPAKYAPQNLGCDPVLLYSLQRAVAGDIQYGAFFDNQLYLFRSLDNKNEFKKNPLKFTRIRHAIRPQSIEGRRTL